MTIHERLFRRSIMGSEHERPEVQAFFGKGTGVFVEVGANDPIAGSQTYHLEQAGWTGILVEPLQDCALRLRALRRALVFEAAGGAPEDDGKDRPLILAGPLSTLLPRTIEAPGEPRATRHVRVRTLDSMLREAGICGIDFVSIDVEGTQHAVLRGFSIETFRPRLMLVEDHVFDLLTHRFLKARGYKLVRRTGLNNWYVPRQDRFPVSLFGRWQILRKLYLALPLRRAKRRFSVRGVRTA